MNFTIDKTTERYLGLLRELGRNRFRPLGIGADRKGEPIPADHPFFKEVAAFGLGGGFYGASDERGVGEGEGERVRTRARRACVLAEEASYWDRAVAASLPGPGLGGAPVSLLGTPEQKERFLGVFRDRTTPRWAAFGMTEPGAGSDVAAIRTLARKDGADYVLEGEKMFCTNGGRAEWVAVWATIDPKLGRAGHRCFVVERSRPGFRLTRIEHKMGLAAYETAGLVLEGCRVPAGNLLGGEEAYRERAGFKGAMKSFDLTRPVVAAMALGIGRAAYDCAVEFVRANPPHARRRDAVRDRLARVRRKLDAGRLLCWRAAWMGDLGLEATVEASMAKAFCPPAAQEATSLAVEVFGEAGALRDNYVEKLFRDVKVLDIVEGTGQIQRIAIARRQLGLPSDRG